MRFLAQKPRFPQIKANPKPIQTQSNPIIWLSLTIKNSVNSVSSVAINKSVKSAKSASKINAFYAKRTQTKPICKTAKMNVYPLLTVYYENLRLFERNENKPKTNPIFCLPSSELYD